AQDATEFAEHGRKEACTVAWPRSRASAPVSDLKRFQGLTPFPARLLCAVRKALDSHVMSKSYAVADGVR
ncbi:MAG: hypothetical protein K0R44_2088, partial [Thermomicrobiales bacterium]|nr:hypothetical protein [Thermomicrobiales bacterium]